MAEVTRSLSRVDLLRVAVRLFFMQALLNRRGMQNLALAAALDSAQGKRDNELIHRHLQYFNCNPNFVPLIAGGVLRLEEEKRAGKPINDGDIDYFKKALASPLAAMGDLLFLGNLKPLALTFACVFAIYKLPIGLLAVFLLYNLAVVSCRLWGIWFGYSKGWELVEVFSGPRFQRVLGVVQGLGAGLGGVLVGIVLHGLPQNGQWVLWIGIALSGVTIYLLRREVPASWFALVLFPVSALVTLLVG